LIIGACVTLYALGLLLQPEALLQGRGLLSFLSPSGRALFQLGMTGGFAWELGWWWTLLTAIYLHGGLLHIFFNIYWIRILGPSTTEVFGPARTFVLFNVAGVVGFLLSNLMSGGPTVGASGAIFGLMAALIVYGRKRGSSVVTQQLWGYVIMIGILGFVMPGVNNWAHGGGFAGGWIVAHLMGFIDEQRESTSMMIASLVLILTTAAGVVMSFIKTTALLGY
jgi:rhomboid protease GluP